MSTKIKLFKKLDRDKQEKIIMKYGVNRTGNTKEFVGNIDEVSLEDVPEQELK